MCINESTGFSPYQLHFDKKVNNEIKEMISFPPSTEIPYKIKIEMAREAMTKSAKNRKKQQTKITKIEIKEVLIKVLRLSNAIDGEIQKFFHIFSSPYRIKRQIEENAFELTNNENNQIIKGIYNRTNLRKYHSR